jgi:hypothetical protein
MMYIYIPGDKVGHWLVVVMYVCMYLCGYSIDLVKEICDGIEVTHLSYEYQVRVTTAARFRKSGPSNAPRTSIRCRLSSTDVSLHMYA